MKKVILKQLRLTNFKGIRDMVIALNGITNILGANRAGKSTIFDSFCWLLFGKDQFDRKDYEIKTLDENNEPLHQLNHEVEGLFVIDGKEERPKRIYKEIWAKKRGEAKATFTGHETVYFWNDVPMKMAEYQAKINSIISEGMFKLITNPLYFNSLPWEKRRACLLDVAGEITDNEIFDKIATPQNDYGNLINILNSGKSTIEYKKEIGAKKIRIKKELEEIPSRIDEADRSKPSAFDWDNIASQITSKQSEIDVIEDSLADASKAQREVQKVLTDRQTSLHNLKTKLSTVRYGIQSAIQAEQNAGANNVYQAEQSIKNLNISIVDKQTFLNGRTTVKNNKVAAILENDEKLQKLRTEYDEIDAVEFKFDDTACVCPTCLQMLQQHDIDVKKQEMLGNFNTDKLSKLNAIVSKAGKLKEETADLQKSIGTIDVQIREIEDEIKQLQAQLPSLKTKLDTFKLVEANKGSFDMEAAVIERLAKDTDAINLNVQIKHIEAELIDPANNPQVVDTTELRRKKSELQTELNQLREKLATKATIEKIHQRITELKRQEEVLSQELAGYEQQEFEILNYDKAKMDILESRINSRFKLVTFKMFNRQINGGEEPACECLFNGVPYPTLNTEAKINCGLDVINVLCDHYQISAPVFIDNRESVTEIIPTNSQIINLIVNDAFKTLQVQEAA